MEGGFGAGGLGEGVEAMAAAVEVAMSVALREGVGEWREVLEEEEGRVFLVGGSLVSESVVGEMGCVSGGGARVDGEVVAAAVVVGVMVGVESRPERTNSSASARVEKTLGSISGGEVWNGGEGEEG